MNLAHAHRKARAAVKRREEDVENEEIEGGEINLIPYLDIVTNLMLFLLMSVASGVLLGQLNTQLPDKGPPKASTANTDPNKDPNNQSLQLVALVTAENIRLFSFTGLEGTVTKPKLIIPRVESDPKTPNIPAYDYDRLNTALYEIANRRWKGKPRGDKTYDVILAANLDIPYGTIISVMDTLRCKKPPSGKKAVACDLPRWQRDKDGKAITEAALTSNQGKQGQPCLDDGTCAAGLACTTVQLPEDKSKRTCERYDPDKHALFHDILFSSGFN